MNKILPFVFVSLMFLSCKSDKDKKQIIEKKNSTEKVKISSEMKIDISEIKKRTTENIKSKSETKNGIEKQTQKGNKTGQKEAVVIVKNKSDYSEKFINGLKKMNAFGDFELIDNFLILNNKDTIEFPNRPEIDKWIVLTARKDNLAIALKVKRINQVSIEYRIEMTEFGKASYNSNGIAEISSGFFLGSESDTYEVTGNSYFSTSYQDENNKCFTYIRLGTQDEKSYLLGKIIKNCNGKIKEINLKNFPVLREK